MSATIYQHPHAPTPILAPYPPVTAQSVIAAISACNAERTRINALTGASLPVQPVPEWCLASMDVRR